MYFAEIYTHLKNRGVIRSKFQNNLQYICKRTVLSSDPVKEFWMSQCEIDDFFSTESFLRQEGYLEKSPSDDFAKEHKTMQETVLTTKWKHFLKKYKKILWKIEYLAKDYPFFGAFIGWATIIVIGDLIVELVSYYLR